MFAKNNRSNLWRSRSWSRLVLTGIGRLAVGLIIVSLGFTVGIMVVMMPPLSWIGVIGALAVLLLWVMPDLPVLPNALVRRLFFVAVVVQLSFPIYYAVVVPGLPWISIRRLTWFPTILLVALILASSSQARKRVTGLMREALWIVIPGIGFFTWMVLSLATSLSASNTLGSIVDATLYWAMAFFGTLLCLRNDRDVKIMLRTLCILTFVAGPLGFIEYILRRHLIFDLWPDVLIKQLAAANPTMMENIGRDASRNGEFRANYIYNVSLSYAEFLAMCAPIAFTTMFHACSWRWRALSAVTLIMCLAGIQASGSRGGFVALAIALPLVGVIWIVRRLREDPNSMAAVLVGATFTSFVIGFSTLAVVWQKLRLKFTGGGEGAGSTDVRWLQWEMAKPSIVANPLTGYGQGVGARVVGYVTPGGTPTVDSYIITLLVDLGLPGLAFFSLMVIAAVVLLIRLYIRDPHPSSVSCLAIAGAVASFTVYRIALSQNENHFLLFVLLGLAVIQIAASRTRLNAAVAPPLNEVIPAPPVAGFRRPVRA